MNELDTFTINFVTEGIDKLLDGMDKLTKQMDKVEKSFSDAGTNGDSFFGKFIAWGRQIAGLTLGFTGLYGVIRSTINGAQEIVNLHAKADLVGHSAKDVEALGIALMSAPGNNIDSLAEGYRAAGDFYKALNNLRLNEALLSPDSELMKQLNLAQTDAILASDSDVEIVRKLRKGIFNYMNSQDPEIASASIEKLLSSAGINNEALAPLLKLSDEDFNMQMELAGLKAWRYTPEQQKEAIELDQAIKNLKIEWARMTDELKPALTSLTNAVESILPYVKDVAAWALKQLGGTMATWGNIWKVIKGEMSLDEFVKTTEKQDNIYGSAVRWGQGIGTELADLEEKNAKERKLRKLVDKVNSFEASFGEMIELKGLMQDMGIYEGEDAKNLDAAIESMKQSGAVANYLESINKGKSTNLDITTNQNFYGYDKSDVGDAAKTGVEKGNRESLGGFVNYSMVQ